MVITWLKIVDLLQRFWVFVKGNNFCYISINAALEIQTFKYSMQVVIGSALKWAFDWLVNLEAEHTIPQHGGFLVDPTSGEKVNSVIKKYCIVWA